MSPGTITRSVPSVRATYIDNNIVGTSHGQVYNLIGRELGNRNWNKDQFSNWHKPGTVLATALIDANAVCTAAEALCGLAPNHPAPNHIFHRAEVQQQFGPNSVVR